MIISFLRRPAALFASAIMFIAPLTQALNIESLESGKQVTDLSLGDFIEPAKGTFFDTIKIKEAAVEKVSATASTGTHYVLRGTIDLSPVVNQLPILKDEKSSELSFTATIYTSTKAKFEIELASTIFSPFKALTIPDLPEADNQLANTLAMSECTLGIVADPKKLTMQAFVEGQVEIFNLALAARVSFIAKKSGIGVAFKAGLPEKWKLSDSLPGLKGLDIIEYDGAFLSLSSIQYIDEDTGVNIRPGLTLYGSFNPKTIFSVLSNVETVPTKVSVYGVISTNIENIRLGYKLANLIPLPTKGPIKEVGAAIEITGTPAINLVLNLGIQPTPKDEILQFTGRLAAGMQDVSIALSMEEMWYNVFGIKGLTLGDVAVELEANYATLMSSGLPSGFGMTAKYGFGTGDRRKEAMFAAKVALSSFVLEAQANESFAYGEIIGMAKEMAINAAKEPFRLQGKTPPKVFNDIETAFKRITNAPGIKQFLNLQFKNAHLKIVPIPTKIGEIDFPMGLTVQGELLCLNQGIGIKQIVSTSGITGEGWIKEIKIGKIFKLSGTGLDKKYGTADDAAIMSINLNTQKQGVLSSCDVELFGIKRQADLSLDKDGFFLYLEGKIGNLFEAKIDLRTSGNLKNPDFKFKAHLKNDFKQTLIDAIKKSLGIKDPKVVVEATKTMQEAYEEIKQKEVDGELTKEEAQKAREEVHRNYLNTIAFSKKQQRTFKKKYKKVLLAANVDIFDPDFRELLNDYPDLFAGPVGDWLKGAFEDTKDFVEDAALKIEEGFGKVRKGFEGFAREFKKIGGKALINLLNTLQIKEVLYEGSLKDMARGVLPHVKLEVVLFGKTVKIDVQADFSKPKKVVDDTIKALLNKIKLGFQGKL